jgi:hypothetical protein
MTVGPGDARFDHGGTAATGSPSAAPEDPPERAPDGTSDPPAIRPTSVVPAWLTGESTLPWSPPDSTEQKAAEQKAAEQKAARATIPPPRQPQPQTQTQTQPPEPVRPVIIPGVPPRPRIVEEPGILGLSRRTRGRFGSRVFTLFFVLVFALIVVQMVVSILYPW